MSFEGNAFNIKVNINVNYFLISLYFLPTVEKGNSENGTMTKKRIKKIFQSEIFI